MRRLSIITLAIMACIAGGAGPMREPGNNAGLTILFGARWCAPCMAEYKNLPALVAAAAPDRLALAWIDQPIAPPSQGAPNVLSLPASEARHLAYKVAGAGYGLPFSVKFNLKGDVCAIWRAPLGAEDFAVLRARCAQFTAAEQSK
jgi:hypothetical protein